MTKSVKQKSVAKSTATAIGSNNSSNEVERRQNNERVEKLGEELEKVWVLNNEASMSEREATIQYTFFFSFSFVLFIFRLLTHKFTNSNRKQKEEKTKKKTAYRAIEWKSF